MYNYKVVSNESCHYIVEADVVEVNGDYVALTELEGNYKVIKGIYYKPVSVIMMDKIENK